MRRKIIISVLAAILFSQSAYAEISCKEDTKTFDIEASGNVRGTEQTGIISLIIVNSEGKEIYQSAFPSENGKFKYIFKFSEDTPSGVYTMKIDSYGLENIETTEINYVTQKDASDILKQINACGAEEIEDVLDSYYVELGISEFWYGKIPEDKDKIAQAIYDARNDGYETVGDIQNVVRKELAIIALRVSNSSEAAEKAVYEFDDIYEFSKNVNGFEYYEALSDNNKKKIFESLSKFEGNEKDETYKAFEEAILINKIVNAEEPDEVISLIDENGDVIDFDLSTYNAADKTAMGIYLFGKDYVTLSDLENMIGKAYSAQNEADSTGINHQVSLKDGGTTPSSKGNGSVINLPTATTPISEKIAEEFNDIGDAEWAREAINYLAEKNIISGFGDGIFAPNDLVTREQFVLMLANSFDFYKDDAKADFEDLPSEHWAYKAVASAYEQGIVSGISEKEFGTGLSIKRQDMAVMAVKAAEISGYSFENAYENLFADMDLISEYAKESINKAVASGIINGYEDNTFRPIDYTTRAQAAQVIYTILKGGK